MKNTGLEPDSRAYILINMLREFYDEKENMGTGNDGATSDRCVLAGKDGSKTYRAEPERGMVWY